MLTLHRVAAALALLGGLAVLRAEAQQPGAMGGRMEGGAMGPGGMGQMGQGGDMGMMGQMGAHDMEMARVHAFDPGKLLEQKDRLSLSSAQTGRLEALIKEVEAAAAKAKTDHDAHHAEVVKLFERATPDAALVRTHVQAALQAQQGEHLSKMVAAAQAKALLNPEQRARVEGWVDAREMMQVEMTRRRAQMQSQMGEMPHGQGEMKH